MLLEHSRPGLVVQRALELFVDNILEHVVDEAEIGIHLLQAPIFFLQLFEPFQIGDFPAAVFAFPSVIGALGDPIFTSDRFDGTAAFALFHDFDDLAFAVASFLHRTFSFGGNI